MRPADRGTGWGCRPVPSLLSADGMPTTVSIRRQLRTAVFLPTALAVAASCIVFLIAHWRSSLLDQQERLRTLAEILAENLTSALAFTSPEDATRVLAALDGEPAVRDAVLFDDAGRTFTTYRAADATRPVPTRPGPDGFQREEGRLTLFRPVAQGGRRFGTLFIRWDLRPWHAEMRTYTAGATAVLALSLGMAVLVGNLLQRRLSEPVLNLARTADQIARNKNFNLRAALPATTELATLAQAFNAMLAETQHVQAELAREVEATRRAEQQLRLVTDATPALISYIDAEERYRFVNRQYERWFNYKRSDVLGRTMTEVLGEAAMAGLRPHFRRALSGETVEFEMEAPYREGGRRWIHAHYIPHRREGVGVLGVVVLVLDLTERKNMEDSLAAAHAELARHNATLEATVQERTARMREVIGELEAFSYSIAHDMRAPLRSMQGFSRLLMEDHSAQLDLEAKSYLQRIVASANRLDRLIQDVLNYSRVVRQDLRMEQVDMQSLIEEIIATYPNLQPPSADIHVTSPVPPVWANPAALTQVISNLLGNAVKFVRPGVRPEVKLSAVRVERPGAEPDSGEWIRLSVADNGIGIPKDSQHRLFAMFQRLHRPELFEGTGMGLAIVRKAVERMGGKLGVESEEGRGSVFWVELRAKESK